MEAKFEKLTIELNMMDAKNLAETAKLLRALLVSIRSAIREDVLPYDITTEFKSFDNQYLNSTLFDLFEIVDNKTIRG